MSHIVTRNGVEYFEFDNTYTGKVSLTYEIKADDIEGAKDALATIAASLRQSGVIGLSSGDADAKLIATKPNTIKE